MARTQAELKIDEEAESGASGPVPGVQALTRGVQLLDLVASAATFSDDVSVACRRVL